MKSIKKQSDKPLLPVKPTDKPKPEELLVVASSLVATAQSCLLSPSAVIATLRCALDIYAQNAINRGFSVEVVEQCEKLGQAMAKVMIDSGKAKANMSAGSGLVDASGAPIQAEGLSSDDVTEETVTTEGAEEVVTSG